jgi:hypothetical protein
MGTDSTLVRLLHVRIEVRLMGRYSVLVQGSSLVIQLCKRRVFGVKSIAEISVSSHEAQRILSPSITEIKGSHFALDLGPFLY